MVRRPAAARAHREAAASRCAGPDSVGDARAPEDRPHRLPVADPPVRRSERCVPVRARRPRYSTSPSASAATPFDIEGVFWSHRGEKCTFDTMLDEFGLDTPALRQLAMIVRGADTARLDLAPESAGLLAASLGLLAHVPRRPRAARRPHGALRRVLPLGRDATDETHNWPTPSHGGRKP